MKEKAQELKQMRKRIEQLEMEAEVADLNYFALRDEKMDLEYLLKQVLFLFLFLLSAFFSAPYCS